MTLQPFAFNPPATSAEHPDESYPSRFVGIGAHGGGGGGGAADQRGDGPVWGRVWRRRAGRGDGEGVGEGVAAVRRVGVASRLASRRRRRRALAWRCVGVGALRYLAEG